MYSPLKEYLIKKQHLPRLRLSLAEIAEIIGKPLPLSAYQHQAWWSKQSDVTTRPQAAAWTNAGFTVGNFDQDVERGWVEFVRKRPEELRNVVS
jgi:hypothetical protein